MNLNPLKWWQEYVAGRLRTPQDIVAASRDPMRSRFFDIPEDTGRPDWVERLAVPPSFFTSEGHLRQGQRADWRGADPRLMFWAASFVEAARRRNIPLYVHCCFRSQEEQLKLWATGRSKVKWPESAHNISLAVDIVHGVYHWDMTRSEWTYLSKLGADTLIKVNTLLPKDDKLSLEWGGAWRFYDPAHWQIASYRSTRTLAEGVAAEPERRLMPRHILRQWRI